MSSGPELHKSIKGVRQFFGDLGRLLVAADGIMLDRGWQVAGDSTCLFWTSMSVSKGTNWIPRVAARQYGCPEQAPNTVAMISLLIDDFEIGYTLDEPAVAGSYFVLPDDPDTDYPRMEHWHACWCGYRSLPLDGTPHTIDASDPYWKESNRFKHMQVFGLPLVEITNQELLQSKVIDPLLNLISTYVNAPSETAKGETAR